jgi:membrane protease YdiL (CAAX protease family)
MTTTEARQQSKSGMAQLRPVESAPKAANRPPQIPNRYRIVEVDGVRTLTCVEAPTLRVRIQRGLTVTEAAARRSPPGSIFLDGAAQGPPFLDLRRSVCNLDHHEGCVRAFTLATCEQAMILILKLADLRKRDWTVHANDGDLDTVIAIWVLLNHLRIKADDPFVRAKVMPLLRLESTIDAHGLELQDLSGLPPAVLHSTQVWMDKLRRKELALQSGGIWQQTDLLQHVADLLRTIDADVYPDHYFHDLEEIEELASIPIADGSLAVACRSPVGIYETERQLRRFYGDRLGVIILQKSPSDYSLRQVDIELPADLNSVYGHLNLLDPAAGGDRSRNRWGGSSEIGGSPRATGTQLRVQQIAHACQRVYGKASFLAGLRRTAGAAAASTGLMLLALAPVGIGSLPGNRLPGDAVPWFAGVLAMLCAAFLLFAARRTPGLYGLRLPAGSDWWKLLPLALIGALAGGVWIPAPGRIEEMGRGIQGDSLALASLVVLPAAAEVLFRGLVHGRLAWSFPIQRGGGRWFVSWPVIASSLLYAPWALLPLLDAAPPPFARLESFAWCAPLAGSLLFGLASGMARERSESLLAPILLHWIGALSLLAALSIWN